MSINNSMNDIYDIKILADVMTSLMNSVMESKDDNYNQFNMEIAINYLSSIEIDKPTNEIITTCIDQWIQTGTFPTFNQICDTVMARCGCPYVVLGSSQQTTDIYKQFISNAMKTGQELNCVLIRYSFMFYQAEHRMPSRDELIQFLTNVVNIENVNNDPVDKHWVPTKVDILEKIKNTACKHSGEKKDNCCICTSDITVDEMTVKLPCNHVFHLGEDEDKCGGIITWLKTNNTCPVCRHKLE